MMFVFLILTQVLCPVCQKKGLKSTVMEGISYSTLIYVPIMYDTNGNLIKSVDPNEYTTNYTCSHGHSWRHSNKRGDIIMTDTTKKDTFFFYARDLQDTFSIRMDSSSYLIDSLCMDTLISYNKYDTVIVYGEAIKVLILYKPYPKIIRR